MKIAIFTPKLAIAALLLIFCQGAYGTGWIECNEPSTALDEETRTCSATFSIDDLQDTSTFHFKGFDGQNEALFVKTESMVQNLDDGTQAVTWFGSLTEAGSYGGSVALYQTTDRLGELVGTFTTPTTGYKIKPMFDGKTHIEATPLPTEAPPEFELSTEPPPQDRAFDGINLSTIVHKKPVGDPTIDTGNGASVVSGGRQRNLRLSANRSLQSVDIVDIQWVLTNRAACMYSGLPYGCTVTSNFAIFNALNLEVNKMNKALSDAEVNVQVRTVGDFVVLFAQSNLDFTPLVANNRNAGLDFMDAQLEGLRNEVGADLLAMISGRAPIVGGGRTLGVASLPPGHVSNSEYFSFDLYVVQHEIGTFKLFWSFTLSFLDTIAKKSF